MRRLEEWPNRWHLVVWLVIANICFLLGAAMGDVAQDLQDVSVTIKAGYAEGSGVIKTRTVEGKKINFVWTAAHVVDDLRRVKTVITADGTERKIVSFDDCSLVKELTEKGRKVGELKMDAQVIRYSAKQDLALLRVRKENFVQASVVFYLDPSIPDIGTPLFHVGSLLGQAGSNSMTGGIVSQIGRVLDKQTYDQTTVTAFPGSSGGGVYLQDGRYVGMIVRGAGESFNLMVPVRRMVTWAKDAGVAWAVDDEAKAPTEESLIKMPIEDVGHEFTRITEMKAFPFLIIRKEQEDEEDEEENIIDGGYITTADGITSLQWVQ